VIDKIKIKIIALVKCKNNLLVHRRNRKQWKIWKCKEIHWFFIDFYLLCSGIKCDKCVNGKNNTAIELIHVKM
jgi:hypothetical protein